MNRRTKTSKNVGRSALNCLSKIGGRVKRISVKIHIGIMS